MSSQQHNGQWIIRDTSRENEREAESRADAETTKNDLVSLGADPEDIEIVPPDTINSKPSESAENKSKGEDNPQGAEVIEAAVEEAREQQATIEQETTQALDKLGESIEHDPLDVLPSYMITHVDNEPTLNKRGVSVLAYHYGVTVEESEILDKPSETDFEHAAVRVRVSIEDGREFVGMGEAHVDEMDKSRLLRMAETRAYKRAVIFATGTGIVGYQEVTAQL